MLGLTNPCPPKPRPKLPLKKILDPNLPKALGQWESTTDSYTTNLFYFSEADKSACQAYRLLYICILL